MEPLNILIIEDDPTTCTLLKTTLEMEGYQVNFVHHVENDDVFLILNQYNPDILFLDYHLGSKDTLKYLTDIRSNANWQHLPVLMTSAIDRSQECLAAGASNFILKPFNWDDITQTVKEFRDQILHGKEA
ncbi:MAG: response regulator [Anaerolineae bacterium]|nr:response regulator [Anaerolineae bacterium]